MVTPMTHLSQSIHSQRLPPRHHCLKLPTDNLDENIDLYVDALPCTGIAQRRSGQRLRNRRDAEALWTDPCDRQAHPIHRHRALGHHLLQQLTPGGKLYIGKLAGSFHHLHGADSIDMPLDDVAAEAVGGLHRPLDVHLRPRPERSERRACHRLGTHAERGDRAVQPGHSQTGAADGDTIAQPATIGQRAQVHHQRAAT
jgi:hypothetical protein